MLGESRAKVNQKGAVGAGAAGTVGFFVEPGSGKAVKGDVTCGGSEGS